MIERYLSIGSLKTRVRDFMGKKTTDSHLQILLYHRILNPDEVDFLSDLGMVHTSTKNFEDHLRWLKNQNYNVINFKQVSEYKGNGHSLPPKSIVITFDDGSLDQYRNAYPCLKSMVSALRFFPSKIVFLLRNCSGLLNFMRISTNWAQKG